MGYFALPAPLDGGGPKADIEAAIANVNLFLEHHTEETTDYLYLINTFVLHQLKHALLQIEDQELHNLEVERARNLGQSKPPPVSDVRSLIDDYISQNDTATFHTILGMVMNQYSGKINPHYVKRILNNFYTHLEENENEKGKT